MSSIDYVPEAEEEEFVGELLENCMRLKDDTIEGLLSELLSEYQNRRGVNPIEIVKLLAGELEAWCQTGHIQTPEEMRKLKIVNNLAIAIVHTLHPELQEASK